MKYLYAIPCPRCPHGELYVMATAAEWPEVRRQAILRHPELFSSEEDSTERDDNDEDLCVFSPSNS